MDVEFDTVAVLPEPGDNAAIAARPLAAGTVVHRGGVTFTLPHDVLEGHRFVVEPIAKDAPVLSWQTPFGYAEEDLAPGTFVCSASSLHELHSRGLAGLPERPSIRNAPLDPYDLDEATLSLAPPVPVLDEVETFAGYRRADGRVGTRNHIVIIGLTSPVGPFAVELARRFAGVTSPGFDGVVPVAHTEAGDVAEPHNIEFVLAVLAGCCVHPNVGAVLLVEDPHGHVTADRLQRYLADHGRGPVRVPLAVLSRTGGFADDLDAGEAIIAGWLPTVPQPRTPCSAAHLAIALQCGGSDAFSGITANPLAGAVGYECIRRGGTACLAETDELIGAEAYVLSSVADVATARRFLDTLASFQARVAAHGQTAEGNPSGGNIYRGLTNIVLKSIGAARKRDRRMRLDHVIDYGQPLPGPGYVFMDSPGNDLESVAGQVAAGCQLIFFTTGNGSITNFPFVPTMKFVTTSDRYRLLSHEMDVDAGRYLTGTPMAELADEVWRQSLDVASGTQTAGEHAGHSQVSIWRDWKQEPVQTPGLTLSLLRPRAAAEIAAFADPDLPGDPVRTVPGTSGPVSGDHEPGDHEPGDDHGIADARLELVAGIDGAAPVPERIVLILPTSLCAGQIAQRIAERATREAWHGGRAARVVALPHTEGCGATGGDSLAIYARTMIGHLRHPAVVRALLLEHGCEKTHNDYFREALAEAGLDPDDYGYASIQRDGGIAAVTDKVAAWFDDAVVDLPVPQRVPGRFGDLRLALDTHGAAAATLAALAVLGRAVVADGGTVVITATGEPAGDPAFRTAAFGAADPVAPTLAYGQRAARPGWHVMRTPTHDPLEIVTGLAATGAELIVVAGGDDAALTVPGHRMVPTLRAGGGPDADLTLTGGVDERLHDLLGAIADVVSGRTVVTADATGDHGFQITRGLLGTSL